MSDDDEIRKKKASRTQTSMLVWVLMAMLITGLGGFGVTNFGTSATAVATVGAVEIEANDYARALRGQINRLSQQFGTQISLEDAKMLGVDAQVLSSLLSNAALDNEAQRIGLSVGDATLAAKLAAEPAFLDVTGKFNADNYKRALDQAGLTVKDYETGLRSDIARSILQAAVVGGVATPKALTEALLAYVGETRGFTLLAFSEASLPTPIAAPSQADLQTFYDAHIASFTRGEAKRIAYVALRPADLAAAQVIEEKAVEELYQSRLPDYVVPEKRLVERLVYPSDAEAQAAKARLDAGESFETLVADRGLALADIDLGDVTRAQLGAAGDAVFALTEPGVVGPLASDLGPALFRMNGILLAQETPLASVKDALKLELQTKAAKTVVADQAPAIDDALAGGATFEELVRDYGMTQATIDYVPGADDNDPIASDAAFVAAAGKLAEGDFPEAIQLDDGSIAALQFVETVPPSPVPLDKILAKVTEAWRADQLAQALTAQAKAAEAAVAAGADLAAQGTVLTIAPVTRDARPEGTTPDVVALAFTMAQGEVKLLDTPDFTGLVRLDSINAADPASEETSLRRKTLEDRARQGLANDTYGLFSTAMTNQGGIKIDQAMINAIQAQLQ